MKKRILLDTNVMRRILEKDYETISIMNYYFSLDYKFVISDHTLFELYDHFDNSPIKSNELSLRLWIEMERYKIVFLYRESSAELQKDILLLRTNRLSVSYTKEILFKSFASSISAFLTNVYCLIIIALANSLERENDADIKYHSNFYHFIKKIYREQKIYYRINGKITKTLEDGYMEKKFKVRKIVKEDIKNIILEILTYYKIMKNGNFEKQKFRLQLQKIQEENKDTDFKSLLKKHIKPDTLQIENKFNMSEYDFTFLQQYIKNIIYNNGSLDINDLVDYLNFISAYHNKIIYYTDDRKSLNKYKKYYSDKNLLEYIDVGINVKAVPYNVVNIRDLETNERILEKIFLLK